MSGFEMDLLTAGRREGDASNGRTQTRENQDNSLYMRNCASLSSQRLIQLISISLDFLLFSFNNLIIRFGCFQDLKGHSSAKIPLLNICSQKWIPWDNVTDVFGIPIFVPFMSILFSKTLLNSICFSKPC